MCTQVEMLPRDSNTANDPASDEDVASDFCHFLDLDEVELFSVITE